MSNSIHKQPDENKAYDIKLDNEIKRSGETCTDVISIDDDDSVLTYGTPSIIGDTTLRVTIAGGVDGTTYKVTVKYTTTLSPILESEFYVVVADT